MSGESSTEIWSWTMCCWTLRDTSNLQTMACARCGLQFAVYERLMLWCTLDKSCYRAAWVSVYSCLRQSFYFCRRAWDQETQRALSAVPPITSPPKYCEERTTVRLATHKHLPEMRYSLSDVWHAGMIMDATVVQLFSTYPKFGAFSSRFYPMWLTVIHTDAGQ